MVCSTCVHILLINIKEIDFFGRWKGTLNVRRFLRKISPCHRTITLVQTAQRNIPRWNAVVFVLEACNWQVKKLQTYTNLLHVIKLYLPVMYMCKWAENRN